MKDIFVLAEHRLGELRDITFEMLTKGRELAEKLDARLTTVLLGYNVNGFAQKLANYAEKVLVVNDKRLRNFNAEAYQQVLSDLIMEHRPLLTMIGHTSYGMDLAPALAIELDVPLVTDCLDLNYKGKQLIFTRQMYGGKVNVEVTVRNAESCMVTIRPAEFKAVGIEDMDGEIIKFDSLSLEDIEIKRFVEYVEPPPDEVNIVEADIIVSVGRGIRDENNLKIIKEFAEALGGEVGCSRPIVDKGWLSKSRQVGSSGKTVKPKLYIALGISGAFQHILGMKNSDSIIAINKDPKAPIFAVSDYGVVEDLFNVIPGLTEKINELKVS